MARCTQVAMRPGLIDGFAPALAVALAAIACGGTVATSPAHDGGGGDAIDDSGSIPDSGTPDAPACATGDAACNSLEVCGPEITLANMMTPAPQPAGGTIADGTYVETAATFYPTGTQTITSGPVRATLQIETTGPGAGMLVVQEISEQGWSAVTYTYTIAVKSPTDLAWASTCGDGARLDTPFTATPSSFQLFYDEGVGIGTVVEIYTKQ